MSAGHWDEIFARDPTGLGWYESTPTTLARVLAESDPSSSVIDVGAGASTLVDHLLDRGYTDLTLVDLSATALAVTRSRLAQRDEPVAVQTIVASAVGLRLDRGFDLWHDRAVFHFLVDPGDRAGYMAGLDRCLAPDGRVVMAVFAPDGPERCAGLAVRRYSEDQLAAELAPWLDMVSADKITGDDPDGDRRPYVVATFVRRRD